ncbi:MAG TPA: class I SAM-dependent methyltransferase, partial [Candidatus Deferrimicrobium sp.]|nr:class I SAM-dependent methyltransferase [Candidatus Deferrimicrobium sp.]
MVRDAKLSRAELGRISTVTVNHYDQRAEIFWRDTRDHDVSQNIQALLQAIVGTPPFRILDFGCGPGRDLKAFKDLGHEPVGLDGSARFAAMARDLTGCEVWHQDFLTLQLPVEHFDGIFANASLFHIPSQELPRILKELWQTLKPRGVLFSSNPRGDNQEGWSGKRYGAYYNLEQWRKFMSAAGFTEITHYYRPPGLPRAEQPWLASLWRKPEFEPVHHRI